MNSTTESSAQLHEPSVEEHKSIHDRNRITGIIGVTILGLAALTMSRGHIEDMLKPVDTSMITYQEKQHLMMGNFMQKIEDDIIEELRFHLTGNACYDDVESEIETRLKDAFDSRISGLDFELSDMDNDRASEILLMMSDPSIDVEQPIGSSSYYTVRLSSRSHAVHGETFYIGLSEML